MEPQRRPRVDIQDDVAGQLDRSGFVGPGRKVNRSAAELRTGLNRVANGLGAACTGVVLGAVRRDVAHRRSLRRETGGEESQD